MTQPVSPEEYDAAVRRDPVASTHAATGDARTGRQLLADAEQDCQRGVAAMAGSPAGRAALDVFSAVAERLAAGHSRPWAA